MLSVVKILLKPEVGGRALNSCGITLLIMENHGIVFFNLCEKPELKKMSSDIVVQWLNLIPA